MKYPFSVFQTEIEHHIFWIAKSNLLKGCVGQGDTQEEAIKELEAIRDNLKKSKAEVIKRMKEENKIEGKDEPINPEAQNPMAAFTGMIK